MRIVIELVDDNLRPLSAGDGTALLKRMLADSVGVSVGGIPVDGHLELADFEGRSVLARIAGVLDNRREAFARMGGETVNVVPLADA